MAFLCYRVIIGKICTRIIYSKKFQPSHLCFLGKVVGAPRRSCNLAPLTLWSSTRPKHVELSWHPPFEEEKAALLLALDWQGPTAPLSASQYALTANPYYCPTEQGGASVSLSKDTMVWCALNSVVIFIDNFSWVNCIPRYSVPTSLPLLALHLKPSLTGLWASEWPLFTPIMTIVQPFDTLYSWSPLAETGREIFLAKHKSEGKNLT